MKPIHCASPTNILNKTHNRIRRSLTPTGKNKVQFSNVAFEAINDEMRSSSFNTSDDSSFSQTEQDWMDLQNRMQMKENEFSEDFDNIDFEQIEKEIGEKDQCLEILREKAFEARERFIWDLAFAVKKQKVAEIGPDSTESVKISNLSCQKIYDAAEKEEPAPHIWLDWINSKYSSCMPEDKQM